MHLNPVPMNIKRVQPSIELRNPVNKQSESFIIFMKHLRAIKKSIQNKGKYEKNKTVLRLLKHEFCQFTLKERFSKPTYRCRCRKENVYYIISFCNDEFLYVCTQMNIDYEHKL